MVILEEETYASMALFGEKIQCQCYRVQRLMRVLSFFEMFP